MKTVVATQSFEFEGRHYVSGKTRVTSDSRVARAFPRRFSSISATDEEERFGHTLKNELEYRQQCLDEKEDFDRWRERERIRAHRKTRMTHEHTFWRDTAEILGEGERRSSDSELASVWDPEVQEAEEKDAEARHKASFGDPQADRFWEDAEELLGRRNAAAASEVIEAADD